MNYQIDKTGENSMTVNENDTSYEVKYRMVVTGVSGVLQEANVYAIFRRFVILNAPVYRGFWWSNVRVQTDPAAFCVFDCTVTYSPRGNEREKRKLPKISGSNIGGTAHKKVSIAQVSANVNPSYAGKLPDMGLGVNWQDGDFEGVDVDCPDDRFNIQIELPGSYFTSAFMYTMNRMVNTVNDAAFDRFGKGELRFLGMSYDSHEEENPETEEIEIWWSITLEFKVSPTVTVHYDGIGDVVKEGWHYLWPLYWTEVDDATKQEQKVLAAVYVNQMYAYADFSVFQFE